MRLPFRLFYATASVATVALLAAACSAKKEEASPVPKPSVSWTVDGTGLEAATITIASPTMPDITFQGVGPAGSSTSPPVGSVELTFPALPYTFSLDDTSSLAHAAYIDAAGTRYYSSRGAVSVTSFSPSLTAGQTRMGGTFSFLCTSVGPVKTHTISNGKFDLLY